MDILRVLKNLDINKAYEHDNLYIRIIKLCGDSIFKPLELIFWDGLKQGKYSSYSQKEQEESRHKLQDQFHHYHYPAKYLKDLHIISCINFSLIATYYSKISQDLGQVSPVLISYILLPMIYSICLIVMNRLRFKEFFLIC